MGFVIHFSKRLTRSMANRSAHCEYAQWYLERGQAAAAGQIDEPNLTFAPNGPPITSQDYWPAQKDNFAPRLAIVYAPRTRLPSALGLVSTTTITMKESSILQQFGSFGSAPASPILRTSLRRETAPRFTGIPQPSQHHPWPSSTTTSTILIPRRSIALAILDGR